jgi:hypothetical protein
LAVGIIDGTTFCAAPPVILRRPFFVRRLAPFCPAPSALNAAADCSREAWVFSVAADAMLPLMVDGGGAITPGVSPVPIIICPFGVTVGILMYTAEITQTEWRGS